VLSRLEATNLLLEIVGKEKFYSNRNKNPHTPESIQALHEAGVLPMSSLEDGKYYYGTCRNTHVAKYCAPLKQFFYIRRKFNLEFPESINILENDDGYDLFFPVCEIEPLHSEIVPADFIEGEINEQKI
jgi:hypothetical protein